MPGSRSPFFSWSRSRSAQGTAADIQPGTLTTAQFRSATLGEDVAYNVYLPAGYAGTAQRYPVLYLLHGRGDSMSAWTQMKGSSTR